MRISRVQIKNFRNFKDFEVSLGEHAVVVGENKIGKSNFLHALRLILDPSLPDSARKLREEDFWDGLPRPLGKADRITISICLADFEKDENQLAVLAEHLVEPSPMVARLTYVWQPLPGVETPTKSAEYEFFIYGGDRQENRISYNVRGRLPFELVPALRDCEADLERWTRSPLRPLLDKAAGQIDRSKIEQIAKDVDTAAENLAKVTEVEEVAVAIVKKLTGMVGATQALDTVLRTSTTEPDKLIRALRLFIDHGRRGVAEASLGSANLLYFALKALEYEQLVADGDRDHTFLGIEEPEAHLHPTLQRLIFRNYLKPRDALEKNAQSPSATVLMTTHSPHIASVAPVKDIVLLRTNPSNKATEGVSTAKLQLTPEDLADLGRYLDVNRGEILFARGVILVEGDAEKFLVPVLARQQGIDLDECGISVCSISGTNFAPYMQLLGPNGLNLPIAALTDHDPRDDKEDGTPRTPLGPKRAVEQMLPHVVAAPALEGLDFDAMLALAPTHGIFVNSHTFEIDLFECGLQAAFAETMSSVGKSSMAKRMSKWAEGSVTLDPAAFLADIEAVGKGRFSQRLASVIAKRDLKECPDYVTKGLTFVRGRTARA